MSDKENTGELWTPDGSGAAPGGNGSAEASHDPEQELSEEELRKQFEEAMAKLTVPELVVDMIVSLASLGFQKMGLPEEANAEYKDLAQAKIAIDCADSLAASVMEHLPEEVKEPVKNTIANLKMNFAQSS